MYYPFHPPPCLSSPLPHLDTLSSCVSAALRDCWPVYDKKQEAQFRKACANWLTRIAKVSGEGVSYGDGGGMWSEELRK